MDKEECFPQECMACAPTPKQGPRKESFELIKAVMSFSKLSKPCESMPSFMNMKERVKHV